MTNNLKTQCFTATKTQDKSVYILWPQILVKSVRKLTSMKLCIQSKANFVVKQLRNRVKSQIIPSLHVLVYLLVVCANAQYYPLSGDNGFHCCPVNILQLLEVCFKMSFFFSTEICLPGKAHWLYCNLIFSI